MTPLLAGAPQAIVREFSQQRARRGRYFSSAANYIEDVFQTYIYTGNNSTQTITNGIDLAGKGGLVWIKSRPYATNHILTDTERGFNKQLRTNETGGHETNATLITALNSNGFSLGAGNSNTNQSGDSYASWTFRKAAKFFDVVTYTGNGTAGRTVAHSLGSVPGCIIIKRTDANGDWPVYHVSLGNTDFLELNQTQAKLTNSAYWNNTTPTSTVFSLGDHPDLNNNGGTYVAYLFAHDAGGFGDSGNDNVISCGSYTGNGSSTGPTVTLGYEPQWILIKQSSASGNEWYLHDSMRGMPVGSADAFLNPNSSAAESTNENLTPTATGFQIATANGLANANGQTYIYIAIRRGPMKTPTDATTVYNAELATGGNSTLFPVDWNLVGFRNGNGTYGRTRLTGGTRFLSTHTTLEETNNTNFDIGFDDMTGVRSAAGFAWNFRRAPGFFDVVAYTGTGANRTVSHNLGVAPELMITKVRSSAGYWWAVYAAPLGATKFLLLNSDTGQDSLGPDSTYWNDTAPTSSVFSTGANSRTNLNGGTLIAYLFASCPGVSKVGSYTGTGTTLSIDCGFTAGARFVLIKRTDSTGDWYVWDTARGIVSGNDPYLLLNSTAAEVTNTDFIDPLNSGFQISSTAPAAINANGGTFIFLAIA